LFLFMMKRNIEGFECYWASKKKEQQQVLSSLELPVINPYSVKGFFKLLRAQYMFIEKSSYDTYYSSSIFGQFHFVQTWHGTPLKKIGIDAKKENPSFNENKIFYKILKRMKFFSRQKYEVILAPSDSVASVFQRT